MNEFTLTNGLKVIHKEITENPLITLQLFTYGGGIHESAEQAGLANFTHSLLFQGTKSRSAEQLSLDIENIGGHLIADVENDFATLGISVLDAHLTRGAELLADIALNPSFPADEIEKERINLQAGIRSRQDRIFQVADDLFTASFYGGHPYSWPDVGRSETVAKFTREDIDGWHREQFIAGNMLLVVTGNVNADKARETAQRYFAAVPAGKSRGELPKAQPPVTKEISEARKFQQAFLMLGFPAPSLSHPDFPALKVLNAMLGGRMSGRLFTELREKLSLAYEVSSFYPSRREMSRFVIYIGLDTRNLDLARRRIGEMIEELKNTPVDVKELEETKNYIRGVYLIDHQTIGRRAWYLGWWDIMGKGYGYDEGYLADLEAVTPADIQRVVRQYFREPYVRVELKSK